MELKTRMDFSTQFELLEIIYYYIYDSRNLFIHNYYIARHDCTWLDIRQIKLHAATPFFTGSPTITCDI